MKRREETGIETGERRRTRRSAARGRVKLSVQTTEIEEKGTVRKVHGRLVRAQRMRADDIGWAIEIDPA